MTKEEAIKYFRNAKGLSSTFDKAADLAIEALQAKTEGDFISRRWLLEVYGDYIGDNGEPKYHVPLEVVRQNIKDAPSAVCDDCIWHDCNYNKVDWDADVVSKGVFDQVKWERDTALKTLKEHGIGFGERADRPTERWIDYSDEGYVECPFCHSATNCDGNKDELHFCFSCGAKMEGGEEE